MCEVFSTNSAPSDGTQHICISIIAVCSLNVPSPYRWAVSSKPPTRKHARLLRRPWITHRSNICARFGATHRFAPDVRHGKIGWAANHLIFLVSSTKRKMWIVGFSPDAVLILSTRKGRSLHRTASHRKALRRLCLSSHAQGAIRHFTRWKPGETFLGHAGLAKRGVQTQGLRTCWEKHAVKMQCGCQKREQSTLGVWGHRQIHTHRRRRHGNTTTSFPKR